MSELPTIKEILHTAAGITDKAMVTDDEMGHLLEIQLLKDHIAALEEELAEAKQQLSTARADERERCAKVACEYCHDGYFLGPGPKYEHTVGGYSVKCKAASIRNLKD